MGLRNPWALGVGSAVAILTQPIEGVLKSGLGSTVICLIDTPSAAVYHMKFKAGMQEACQQVDGCSSCSATALFPSVSLSVYSFIQQVFIELQLCAKLVSALQLQY